MARHLPRRAFLAAPLLLATPSRAAEGTIRLIVSFAAGGAADTTARLLQPKLSEALNQPVVVENRGGAGGTIGAVAVAQAPPDGRTLLLDAASHVVAPLIHRNLPVDFPSAFTPIGQITSQPYAFLVTAGLAVRDMAGFLALARAREQPIAYGSPGNGSIGHIAGEALAETAAIRLQHVPYRGGGDVVRDLAGGTLEAACIAISSGGPVAQSGRAHFIAVTSAVRSAMRPDVPTVAETTAPGFDVTTWNGLFGPAGMARADVQRISAALMAACNDPLVQERLSAAGFEPAPSSPEDFAARVRRDRETFGAIVRRVGVAP